MALSGACSWLRPTRYTNHPIYTASSNVYSRPCIVARLVRTPAQRMGQGPLQSSHGRCTATGVMEGQQTTADACATAIAEGLLRRWLAVQDSDSIPMQQETAPLRDTACSLTVCATAVKPGGRHHIVAAIVITNSSAAGSSNDNASESGSKQTLGPNAAELRSPVLHWGCVHKPGSKWSPPPAGWSTWPDISYDARGGAWQTPFAEQDVPGTGPVLTMLLQIPCDGPLRSGGLAFLVKAGGNSWLGNAATYSDFFFSTAQLPEVPVAAITGDGQVDHGGSALAMPGAALDMKRLAEASPSPAPQQQQHSTSISKQKHEKAKKHTQQEPELPNAGRRAKEPAKDESQVCTISITDLQATAVQQLGAWVTQQDDLEVPAAGLTIQQHEFAVEGHPSTSLVVAGTALWRHSQDGNGSSSDGRRQAVLLLAALCDVGISGRRVPGLVMHWSGSTAPATAGANGQEQQYSNGVDMQQQVAVGRGQTARIAAALPDGWNTLPDLSWDAGAGFWDTPMTRHLLPNPQQTSTAAAAALPGDSMYVVLLRLPLKNVFCSGGLLFNLCTSRRQWITCADGKGYFFLDTSAYAQQLGLVEKPAVWYPVHTSSMSDAAAPASLTSGASADAAATGNAANPAAAQNSGSSNGTNSISNLSSEVRVKLPSNPAGASLANSILPSNLTTRSTSTAIFQQGGPEWSNTVSAAAFLRDFEPEPVPAQDIQWGMMADANLYSWLDVPGLTPNQLVVDKLALLEHKACRSLMHRYNIAADLVQELLPDLQAAATAAPKSLTWPPQAHVTAEAATAIAARGTSAMSGLVAVAVWLRFSTLRLLVWNHNYNVKPREISAALDRLGASLVEVYEAAPQLSGVVLLALASAGRGGEGDMGQRIRDEILAIQQRNGCKGGMMEEWHQKLHNNSSPDDLAICQALLAYLASGLQEQVYWDSLAAEGITAARLASYDRPIRSPPPKLRPEQVEGLTRDLVAYKRTLAAVHSGADLSAAVDGVLGYDAGECKGKHVKVEPLTAVATPRLKQLLSALLSLVACGTSSSSPTANPRQVGFVPPTEDRTSSGGSSKVSAMLEMEKCLKTQALVVAARHCLAGPLRAGNTACQGRLRDVLFLDLALELTGRNALEQGLAAIRAAAPFTMLGGLLALLQQPLAAACMSCLPGQGGNAGLVTVLKQLQQLSRECPGLDPQAKACHALSVVERLRSLLAASALASTAVLQPTADTVGAALKLDTSEAAAAFATGHDPVSMLAEEVVRGSAAAALSQLLAVVEPSLRRLAGVGAWTVLSRLPSTVTGLLKGPLPSLTHFDPSSSSSISTILLLERLDGDEEIPAGVVGVIVLGDCPDVLSHAAVRARNCRTPVVACPSAEEAAASPIKVLAGQQVRLSISGDDVKVEAHSGATGQGPAAVGTTDTSGSTQLHLSQSTTVWDGQWVLTTDSFRPGVVGAKAMSAARLEVATAASRAVRSSAAHSDPHRQQQQHSDSVPAAGLQGNKQWQPPAWLRGSAAAESGPGQHRQLPAWLKVPVSVALPHGTFEAVLQAPINRVVAQELSQLAEKVATVAAEWGNSNMVLDEELDQIRLLVHQLQVPQGLQHELTQQLGSLSTAAAAAAGGALSTNSSSAPAASWDGIWLAIKGVWASQWNRRAVTALTNAKLSLQHLRMGILLQPLLPARYSWVAHTVNPATGSSHEIVVQLVAGLGEVLVGNHPGRALSGVVSRQSVTAALSIQQQRQVPLPSTRELLQAVNVVSYPSKGAAILPAGLQLPCAVQSPSSSSRSTSSRSDSGSKGGFGVDQMVWMARSDSNAEDLPGFAGAGLFDSYPSLPTQSVLLDYTQEPLVWDKAQAAGTLWQCAAAAVAAEQALGEDGCSSNNSRYQGLDVEGCLTMDGSVWLLQARPQV